MVHHWKYQAQLPARMTHSVQVQTDSADADFNLLILDAAGNVLAADRGPEAGAECTVHTVQKQDVVFIVELLSGSGAFSLQVSSKPGVADRPSAPAVSQKPVRPSNVVRPVKPVSPSKVPPAAGREPGGSTSTGSRLTSGEARALLGAHNRWRDRYGVAAMTWSSELAAVAQAWADQLEAEGMQMRHRSPNDYGENLYWCSGRRASADDVVDAWGNEVELYDYDVNNWWPHAGHFSQVVWHNTTQVGGAVARANGQELWVCNYDPRGNWTGQRPFER